MRNLKKSRLVSSLILLSSVASAQSLSGLVGSTLTIEESLVQFVNSVTTFQVSGAEEVLLYVVTPLIGFYYLTLNFVSMAYENFQDRVDRAGWNNTDEGIPTGMKGFSMIISFITVLFLGTAGAGLLLIAGLTSFALGLLMFFGLFEGQNEQQQNQGGQQQQPQQTQQQGQQQNQQQQQTQGGGWANALNAAANLMGTAQNTAQNLQQQGQQQTANQLQESLRYFSNDMIDESEKFFRDFSNIRQLIQDAETESKNSDVDTDKFQTINRRVADLHRVLTKYNEKITEDFGGAGSRTWNSSELKTFHDSQSPIIAERAEMISNQFQNITTSSHVPPPDDKLRELMKHHLGDLAAVGHFMAEAPYDLGDIATDDSIAQKIENAAKSMNVMEDRGGRDEKQELQALCSKLENQDNPKILIEEAIKVAEKDLKIEDAELNFFKEFLKKDGKIMQEVEDIERHLSHYATPSGSTSGLESQLTQTENFIDQAMNYASGIESEINQHGKYETDILKRLKDIDSKI